MKWRRRDGVRLRLQSPSVGGCPRLPRHLHKMAATRCNEISFSITIGRWVATTSPQVITGKTLTTTFQNMSIDGVRTKMSWSEGTQTIKRIK